MIRLYLRLILIPTILFTAVLLLIHAQPYDDHDLRALLLPEGCPAPCFMGIRPGITTVDEAIKILKASGWMEGFDSTTSQTRIRIRWNDASPSWLDNYNDRFAGGSGIWFIGKRVIGIDLDTNLSLGTLELILGTPPFQWASGGSNIQGRGYIGYEAAYPDNGLALLMVLNCNTPITYQSNVILTFQEISALVDKQSLFKSSWSDALRARCTT